MANAAVGIAVLVAALAWTTPVLAQQEIRVRIWAKAFIPNVHPKLPSYFLKTAKGTWVVPAPLSPLPGTDIGKLSGTCFATDNRSFDSSADASARVTTEAVLVIRGRDMAVEAPPGRAPVRIGPTQNVDCTSGELLQPEKSAKVNSASVGAVRKQGFNSVINLSAASPNPFYTLAGVSVAPDIDYEMVVQYSAISRALTINGSVGAFPSFEAYYSVNSGPVTKIVTLAPEGESTAVDLFDFGLGLKMRNFTVKVPLQ